MNGILRYMVLIRSHLELRSALFYIRVFFRIFRLLIGFMKIMFESTRGQFDREIGIFLH